MPVIYHVQCTSDAVPGNALDNPAYNSTTVGENAKLASVYPQRVEPHSPSPSANFDNPIYGMPEEQQLETAQHESHSEPHKSHEYGNMPNFPMHENVSYEQRLQVNNNSNMYPNTEILYPETVESPPEVEFRNVFYEPSNRAAI